VYPFVTLALNTATQIRHIGNILQLSEPLYFMHLLKNLKSQVKSRWLKLFEIREILLQCLPVIYILSCAYVRADICHKLSPDETIACQEKTKDS
jgi:hypothetical protein